MGAIDKLTRHQLHDLVACYLLERGKQAPFSSSEAADVLEVEITRAGRFLRLLREYRLVRAIKDRRQYLYQLTVDGRRAIIRLRRGGRLPGVCCVCGGAASPYAFRQRYFCRSCLMVAKREDYPIL